MSKICLISDNHFGAHLNDETFLESQLKFYYEQFVVYLQKNKIKDIFFLGDLYEHRSQINVKILDSVYKLFERLKSFNIIMIPGNHDNYYRNNTEVHSLKMFSNFKNVRIIDTPQKINMYGKDFLFVPWQSDNTYFNGKFLNESADVCFGHFDIINFHFNKFERSSVGLCSNIFYDRFKIVFSGHYHTRSRQDNIQYIGSPYQLTRVDKDDDRGFVVLDVDNLSYDFVQNNKSIKYFDVVYGSDLKPSVIEGNMIDVIINYDENYDGIKVDKYIESVKELKPAAVNRKVISKFISEDVKVKLDENKVDSVRTLIAEYMSKSDDEDRVMIEKDLIELYEEVC